MQQRIAITGASGFIGGAFLADRLEHTGTYEVRALVSRPGSEAVLRQRHPRAAIMPYTIGAGDVLAEPLQQCDVLVHCGWSSVPGTATQDIHADLRSNVEGSLKLFRAAASAGVRRIVFLSSGGTVYGDTDVSPIPESQPPMPIGAYGAAKLCAERYLEVIADHYGLAHCILRPGNVHGRTDGGARPQGVVEQWMLRAISDTPIDVWGDTGTIRDYVHISDMVQALHLAVRADGPSGTFNVGTGVGTTLTTVLEELASLKGKLPAVNYHGAVPGTVPSNVLDTTLASEVLGFRARTTLREGMRHTWQRLTGA